MKILGVLLIIIGIGSLLSFKAITGTFNGGFGIIGSILQFGLISLGYYLFNNEKN